MNPPICDDSSVATKIQQAYWEAKRNFTKSLGNREDDHLIASDSDLDTRIEFLEAADFNFNALLGILVKYNKALLNLMKAEDALGTALIEYGVKDTTKAGKLMAISGKCLCRGANRRSSLKTLIMKLYYEIETFQFKATVDVLQTVQRMERSRKSYRSGLMWMKNESQNLDPEVAKKLVRFRKVQDHIKNLKVRFDRAKLEVMQKIDLYLFSRCNLFSQNLVPYCKTFCKMNKHFAIFMKYATQNIPNCYSYKFEIIKELNDYYVAPEKLPLSFEQQYPRAIIKSQKLEPDINRELRNSTFKKNLTPEFKKRPEMRKRVQFQDCVESKNDLLNKEASLLINLNDETESQMGTKPSISSTNNGKLTGKYSEDLLSLNLDANQSENDSKTVVGNKDFQNEMDKCVSFLDSITDQPPLQTNTSDLQFWSLMTNYVNSKDSSLKSYNFLENASGGDSVNAKLSHLENVLTEFDPFSFCKSTCMKRNGINESC